jgi:uncharacterized protein YbjT (DUF2867 family)
MNKEITITVFGANGNLGSHFVNQALEAGFKIKAFVVNKLLLSSINWHTIWIG